MSEEGIGVDAAAALFANVFRAYLVVTGSFHEAQKEAYDQVKERFGLEAADAVMDYGW